MLLRGFFLAIKMKTVAVIVLGTALFLFWTALFLWPQKVLPVQQQGSAPLSGQVVVLDPGHGGIDSGVHYGDLILEKDINLKLSLALKKILEELGAEVKMTRDKDQDTSHLIPGEPDSRYQRDVWGRVKFINESGASFFISLHVNSCHDPSVRGSIAFYCDRFQENYYLAQSIQKHLNKVVLGSTETNDYVHRQIKEGDFYVLNETIIPGIILEAGFLTNPEERELLTDPGYREKLALAISQGIIEYIDLLPVLSSSWEEQEAQKIYALYFN